MTPREAGTEDEPTAPVWTVDDVQATKRVMVPTGARLGPARVVLGLAAAALGVRYVAWQVSIAPPTILGHIFTACEGLALAIFLMTLTVLLDRGRRSAPGSARGSLDVFITVCGEPPEVVEAAIRAALEIDHPHRTVVLNDGRIAGKPGWEEIDRLGARLGVDVLTRTAGARSKAGNLNHGLAHSTAEFVATIDGDHRADPDLATRLLGWFDESKVAFASAAQRFDVGDDDDILNNRQPFFFGWLQRAKDAGGYAISCGSGVVYRRAALDDVGGFSEWNVVEDLHTSYRLHAAGWASVYEPEPVTTGLAPRTAAEYAHQRSRWALDTMRILFFDNPLRRPGLSLRGRLHYLHTTTAYLLALPMALFLVGPPLYLIARVHVAGGASGYEYLAHAVPYLAVLLLFFASMVGFRGALATFRSTVFDSWLTVVAIVKALSGSRKGGVTKKRGQRRTTWLLAPQLIAVGGLILSLVVALVDERPGTSTIAVTWAAINALALAGPLAAFDERRRTSRRTTTAAQSAVGLLAVTAIAVTGFATSAGSVNLPLADPEGTVPEEFAVPAPTTESLPLVAEPPDAGGPAPAGPVVRPATDPTQPVPADAAAVGPTSTVPTDVPTALVAPVGATYAGISAEGVQSVADGITAWSAAHGGAAPQIVNWFQQWGSGENRFREDWVRTVADQGAIPMVTWEPWAKPDGEYADPDQTEYRLERIIAGDFDTYIRAWAAAAAAHRGPILLRFMHEFNGLWYPWSIGLRGQTPEQFVAAWRHVHDIFQESGATNVSWIWSVIGDYQDPRGAYPGDDAVDWVATTVLNPIWAEFGGSQDYAALTAGVYDELAAYGKPIMLSEVASNQLGGDQATWLDGMFDTIAAEQPEIAAVVYFDMPYDDRTDYRLTDDAAAVVAAAMSGGRFAPTVEVRPG